MSMAACYNITGTLHNISNSAIAHCARSTRLFTYLTWINEICWHVNRYYKYHSASQHGKLRQPKLKRLKSTKMIVSRFGLAVRRLAGKKRDLGSNLLRLSFLFKRCGLWTLSSHFVPKNNETLQWFSSLLTLMQESLWWWQCSDRYIISTPHPQPPSLPYYPPPSPRP